MQQINKRQSNIKYQTELAHEFILFTTTQYCISSPVLFEFYSL